MILQAYNETVSAIHESFKRLNDFERKTIIHLKSTEINSETKRRDALRHASRTFDATARQLYESYYSLLSEEDRELFLVEDKLIPKDIISVSISRVKNKLKNAQTIAFMESLNIRPLTPEQRDETFLYIQTLIRTYWSSCPEFTIEDINTPEFREILKSVMKRMQEDLTLRSEVMTNPLGVGAMPRNFYLEQSPFTDDAIQLGSDFSMIAKSMNTKINIEFLGNLALSDSSSFDVLKKYMHLWLVTLDGFEKNLKAHYLSEDMRKRAGIETNELFLSFQSDYKHDKSILFMSIKVLSILRELWEFCIRNFKYHTGEEYKGLGAKDKELKNELTISAITKGEKPELLIRQCAFVDYFLMEDNQMNRPADLGGFYKERADFYRLKSSGVYQRHYLDINNKRQCRMSNTEKNVSDIEAARRYLLNNGFESAADKATELLKSIRE